MGLDFLLDQVKNAIYKDPNTQYKEGDSHGLIDQITGMFGQHAANNGQNIKSSNDDPYGDPANNDSGFRNVKSSNEDPYGDPADNER